MPFLALALASLSSLHTIADTPAKQEVRVQKRVSLGTDAPLSTMKRIFKNADGTVMVNIDIDAAASDDFDVNALLSKLGSAQGNVKIVVVGPDGKKQVIERELSGIDAIVDQLDIEALLGSIDLNAYMDTAHGSEHAHGERSHDHSQNHVGGADMRFEVITQDGDRTMRRIVVGDMDQPVMGHWSTHPPQHDDDHNTWSQSGDGDDAWIVVTDADEDMMYTYEWTGEGEGHPMHMPDMGHRRAGEHMASGHQPNVAPHINDRWQAMTDRVRGNFNSVQQRHGQNDDRHKRGHGGPHADSRSGHDAHPGDHGDMGMDPEIREHVMEMMRQGFHMPEGMNPLDAHRRNDGHGEGHGSDHGDMDMHRMHMDMMRRGGHDDGPHGEHGSDHGDMDMHRMHMDMMRRGGHDDGPHGEHGSDHGDMDMHRMHMDMMRRGGHDDGPHGEHGSDHGDMDMHRMHMDDEQASAERFFHASTSFKEQLAHAKAVGDALAHDDSVALLAIWYASEHMSHEVAFDLMVSIMNDDSVRPTVRRAAAFTGAQIATGAGDDQAAGRILGAIIRGTGMTAAARNRYHTQRETDHVTDRAPQGKSERDTKKQQDRS